MSKAIQKVLAENNLNARDNSPKVCRYELEELFNHKRRKTTGENSSHAFSSLKIYLKV